MNLNRFILKQLFKLQKKIKEGHPININKIGNVEVCPFKYGRHAAVCITTDFELCWAWRFKDHSWMEKKGRRGRENVSYILSLLEKYGIPITWATVGHLFLDECKKQLNGLPHTNMPRPNKFWNWSGDWYMHDPCTSFKINPLWYAPDLIEMILNSKINHELGCHSFSHIEFSEKYCYDDLVECELYESIKAMKKFDVKPKSFVFPFNICTDRYDHIFEKYGFTSYRYRDFSQNLSYPQKEKSEIWKFCESLSLRRPRYYNLKNIIKIYLDKAMKKNFLLNFWFHPSDHRDLLENEFTNSLKIFKQYQDDKKIWISTMNKISEYCNAINDIILNVDEGKDKISIKWNAQKKYINSKQEISFKVKTEKKFSEIFTKNERHVDVKVTKNQIELASKNSIVITVPIKNNEIILKY